jgi:hypothetical protein
MFPCHGTSLSWRTGYISSSWVKFGHNTYRTNPVSNYISGGLLSNKNLKIDPLAFSTTFKRLSIYILKSDLQACRKVIIYAV